MSEEKELLLIGIEGDGAMAAIDFFAQNNFAHYELDWPAKAAVANAFGIGAQHLEDPALVNLTDVRYEQSPAELMDGFSEWAKFTISDSIWVDTARRAMAGMGRAPEMQHMQGMTVAALDMLGRAWVREQGKMLVVVYVPDADGVGIFTLDNGDTEVRLSGDDEKDAWMLAAAAQRLGVELDDGRGQAANE